MLGFVQKRLRVSHTRAARNRLHVKSKGQAYAIMQTGHRIFISERHVFMTIVCPEFILFLIRLCPGD